MATSLSTVLRFNPDLINANCYLFALAPKLGRGGYARRPHKAQPGEKCFGGNVPPLPFRDSVAMRQELIERVQCDNPQSVKFLNRVPYDLAVLTRARPGEEEGKRHLIACIYGSSDFHFLRRMYLSVVLKSLDKLQPMTDAQYAALKQGKKDGKKFVWVHQRGWMPPDNTPRPRTLIRRRSGMLEEGFGSPTAFDAKGNPCWSCVPIGAPEANPRFGYFAKEPPQSDFNYPGMSYSHLCGLFSVKTGMASVYSGRDVELDISQLPLLDRKAVQQNTRLRLKGALGKQ